MIIISECLLGCACRYDGSAKADAELIARYGQGGGAVPVCPECLGGLKTPRAPSEIESGDNLSGEGLSGEDVLDGKARVLVKDGTDVTGAFLKGAYETLKICVENGAKLAILKARSPSCGCGEIYDGSFSGKLIRGDGVTAALLKRNGIEVISR